MGEEPASPENVRPSIGRIPSAGEKAADARTPLQMRRFSRHIRQQSHPLFVTHPDCPSYSGGGLGNLLCHDTFLRVFVWLRSLAATQGLGK
jgi:hypothetical protein